MKKALFIISFMVMLFSMAGCSLKEPEDVDKSSKFVVKTDKNSIVLVLADLNSAETIVGMTDQKFKEEVERRSNGEIVVDIQASGVLGSEADVLDTMIGGSGTIDLARVSAYALASYGVNKAVLLSLPYVFEDREHFWKFAKSDVADEFLSEPSEIGCGVRGLFYGEEGFRHFFTKDPVEKVADLKGKKLRVASDPVMNGLVESLGASPTIVSFGELYSALQTGVVDGAEQPTTNYRSNAFNEVAPNLILDGHTIGIFEMIITDEAWNKLTPEQQQIIIDSGNAAAEYDRSISEEKEKEVLEKLEGVNIVQVEDKTEWQDAVKDFVTEYTKGYEDLYQKVLDTKNLK